MESPDPLSSGNRNHEPRRVWSPGFSRWHFLRWTGPAKAGTPNKLLGRLLGLAVLFPLMLWAELPLARLHSVFPPGGQAGTQIEVGLEGTDLDEVTRLH